MKPPVPIGERIASVEKEQEILTEELRGLKRAAYGTFGSIFAGVVIFLIRTIVELL